jgi:3-methyladenine DNA glycosylase AlkD
MHKHHKEILNLIQKNSSKPASDFNINNYLGSKAKYYSIKTLVKRKLIKDWARNNKNIQFSEFIDLLNSLNCGESFQEKSSVAELLTCFKKYRQSLDPFMLDKWLNNLSGWAEIDTLCQSTFEPEELLSKWQEWQKLLKAFVNSKNISKRRASLVLLTKAVRKSKDERLKNFAFKNIKKLQHEKDILITKAVSWLLRSLVKNHKEGVSSYLKENKELLPKIAYRETFSKLKTGKKYVNKKS